MQEQLKKNYQLPKSALIIKNFAEIHCILLPLSLLTIFNSVSQGQIPGHLLSFKSWDKSNVKYSGNITYTFKTNGSESKDITRKLCHNTSQLSLQTSRKMWGNPTPPCWCTTTGHRGCWDPVQCCLWQTFTHKEMHVPSAERTKWSGGTCD